MSKTYCMSTPDNTNAFLLIQIFILAFDLFFLCEIDYLGTLGIDPTTNDASDLQTKAYNSPKVFL